MGDVVVPRPRSGSSSARPRDGALRDRMREPPRPGDGDGGREAELPRREACRILARRNAKALASGLHPSSAWTVAWLGQFSAVAA
jgi:hypothetical protein